jgi:chromosome segregation ATPase
MAEQTKDQLQALVTQLTNDLANAKNDLANATQDRQSLRDALTLVKTENSSLKEQLDQERAQNGEVAGELNEAQGMIEELTNRLAQAEQVQAESGTVVVTDGSNHYKVIAPKFKHKNIDYTADQLRGNEELVQELVKADVGFLVKIETEK